MPLPGRFVHHVQPTQQSASVSHDIWLRSGRHARAVESLDLEQDELMVFTCKDGAVAQPVWDAVLYELDLSKDLETLRLSPGHRWHAADVLNNHVTKQLDELSSLRQKLDVTEGENTGLIRLHNEFLTTAFSRVQANLKEELEIGQKCWSNEKRPGRM